MHRRRALPPLFAALLLASLPPAAARADLLISEMCDPRLDYATDRFIEIYNAGTSPVDLAGWHLVAVANNADAFTWALSGTIDPGEALVAGDATTVDAFPVDFPAEAWSSANGNWNGKVGDGARLVDPSAAVVDYAVVDGTRFENADYKRVYTVTAPNTTYTPAEWSSVPVDHASQGTPGTHSTQPPVPVPVITSVTIDPIAPLAGQTVDVQAIVTDAASTITSVTLAWGTSSGALPDSIAMPTIFGNVRRTVTPIPGQSEGVTVYYRIRAVNAAGGSTTTGIYSYMMPVTVAIAAIQGGTASSPYAGQPVVTGGVVTGVYGTYAVLQDGGGPWNGVWVNPSTGLAAGDSVSVRGIVSESTATGFEGTTVLTTLLVLTNVHGAPLPPAFTVPTVSAGAEAYEGVLLHLAGAVCADADLGRGWAADDGTGACVVGHLGSPETTTLGTVYDVTGIVRDSSDPYLVEPRDASDVTWIADPAPPSVAHVAAPDPTHVVVTFSEDVEPVSAGTAGNYGIPGLTVGAAVRDASDFAVVTLSVSPMTEGPYVLSVDDVEDLYGNAASGAAFPFQYIDWTAPAGYYDAAQGLDGEALRLALHGIIDGHVAHSYDFAWSAYYTTDDKPNGKVWDIYSDVPGGTPPYEYTFGVDEGGTGGTEGTGYTREHSFPKSWFGGEVAPMFTDLFALYPCDAHVNGNRGTFPYGEVASPDWISLNGSRRGTCASPGYSGVVFEPIDAYKGDLARTYFYMSTRYATEDAAWPGGPMTDGADLLPWAVDLLLAWHEQDPVSQKEIERNGTIHGFQGNRNPFIDHPEFAEAVWGDAVGVDPAGTLQLALHPGAPNPFGASTTIRFALAHRTDGVSLGVFDVSGRLVRTLRDGTLDAGAYESTWDGRDGAGHRVASGTYFIRLVAGDRTLVRKATRVR